MKVYNQRVSLIVETPPATADSKSPLSLQKQLEEGGVPIEKIVHKKGISAKGSNGKAAPVATNEKAQVETKISDAEMNPWDVAHLSAKAMAQHTFVEPDLLQEFVTDPNIDASYKKNGSKSAGKTAPDTNFDPDWKPAKNTIWHLGDGFSQLKTARDAVMDLPYIVRIGHLDTGYNKTHVIVPDSARNNPLQRNFVEDGEEGDAHDRYTEGHLRMPGHGTGTLGILAGTKIKLNTDDGVFNDYIGGAPFAEVICCRVASSVILMKTTAFADALTYLINLTTSGTQVHVVSMSMGGAPTKAWADAVNAAYEAGITIVTASGNNFNGLPTQHVIYPARFERVIAACGITYDFKPYHTSKIGEMQGCYGPARHMDKALAAFTPNTPWASGNESTIKFSGAGTSSATPQIAAAAAIYYRKYSAELDALEPWQRVEAIRNALYKSTLQKDQRDGPSRDYFGNGIIQAAEALAYGIPKKFTKAPEDVMPWFPILTTMFKSRPGAQPNAKLEMFNTELAQLVYYYPELRAVINNDEKPYEKISDKKWQSFADAVIAHPGASLTLKKYLMATHATSKKVSLKS